MKRAVIRFTILLVAGLAARPVSAAPALAIFSDPDFPYWAAPMLTGPDMQAWFTGLGLTADLLDATALADPARFNATRYAALIHLYGNTFPVEAAANLRQFHVDGGGFVSAGVPFCHPCRQTGAAGWTWVLGGKDHGERTLEAAHSGGYGLLIHKEGTGWSGITQAERLPAQPGETFTLGGWAKTVGTHTAPDVDSLLLRFWDAAGGFLGQTGPALPPPGGDWAMVQSTITTPPRTAAVDVVLAVWQPPATVWLDDLVLTRGPLTADARNLLPNPGFEEGGGEWLDGGHVEYFGPAKLGTGGFYTSPGPRGELAWRTDADPLGLAVLDPPRWQRRYHDGALGVTQALNPASLPPGDTVEPLVWFEDAAGKWPVVALLHHGGEPAHPTDVWAGVALFSGGDPESVLAQREVYGRAALYLLRQRGAVADTAALLRRADVAYQALRPGPTLDPSGDDHAAERVFPASAAPARRLSVVDASGLPLDEKLALVSLQGVINAKQPRLYLITDHAAATKQRGSPEERWLEWLEARGDIDSVEKVADPWSLLTRWPDELRGAVITDPELPATVNLATMLCGLEHAVMLSPRLSDRLKLPVVADLRGRWHTNVEAYTWAIDNLWPRLDHHLLGLMYPDWPAPRDYLIAHHAFCFWITGPKDARPGVGAPLAETALLSRLLGQAPVNIGVLGAPWAGDGVGIQEGPGVNLLSTYGKFLAWSAETGNLSVHAGTRALELRHAIPDPPPLDRGKVYLSFMVSDGDAPINWYSFFLTRYWDDPERGKLPLAWSLGPSALDLMPDLMDWYYRQAGPNDTFVCACSGVGYCYPGPYAGAYRQPDNIFGGFVERTARAMGRLDERGLWTHSADAAHLARYAAGLPGLQYFLPDYGRQSDTTVDNTDALVAGVPSFRAVCTFDPKGDGDRALELLVKDIRAYTPRQRPAFLNAFVQCYPCSPTLLRRVLDQLGPDYVPVLPEHLAALYRANGGRP